MVGEIDCYPYRSFMKWGEMTKPAFIRLTNALEI